MGKSIRKSSIILQVHSMGEIAGTQRTSEVENREVQKVPFETTAFFFYQWYGYVLSNSTIITFFQLSRILCMHLILVKYIPEALPLTHHETKIYLSTHI